MFMSPSSKLTFLYTYQSGGKLLSTFLILKLSIEEWTSLFQCAFFETADTFNEIGGVTTDEIVFTEQVYEINRLTLVITAILN